jgi:hypothetical protein
LQTQLTWYDHDHSILRHFTAGVSIHGHTNRSRESLVFVERSFASNSLLRAFILHQNEIAQKRAGIKVDLSRAYWTPPLCPRSAYEVEREQIEHKLGLKSMISLSDHDSIEAPQLLRIAMSDVPISLEWTVPFRISKFHLGVHNLPAATAQRWMDDLEACTRSRSVEQVCDTLRALHAEQDVLVVFNHPMWNLYRNPPTEFARNLEEFLKLNNHVIHAFELNGLRGWEENRRTADLAMLWKQVVISGGDRHGLEPNANLNLTRARSFAEWVQEIRIERRSHVMFMPQYSHSLVARRCQTFLEAIREYPNQGDGAMRWDQRTFHPGRNGEVQALSEIWRGTPPLLLMILSTARLAESTNVLDAMRILGVRNMAQQARLRKIEGSTM